MARAESSKRPALYRLLGFGVPAVTLALALVAGSGEKWIQGDRPLDDEGLDTSFFSGLNAADIPNVPEPTSLRPCCIFGNDIGAQVGSIPVPGYEIRYVLEGDSLGTHRFNRGPVALQAGLEKRILSDEASGILYTCRGGFIDIAHVRDNVSCLVIESLGETGSTSTASGGTPPSAFRTICSCGTAASRSGRS